MWTTLRRFWNYSLIGFIVTFVIYLFVRFDADKVILGIVIGIAGGLVLSILIFVLEHRFPDQSDPNPPIP